MCEENSSAYLVGRALLSFIYLALPCRVELTTLRSFFDVSVVTHGGVFIGNRSIPVSGSYQEGQNERQAFGAGSSGTARALSHTFGSGTVASIISLDSPQ